MFHPIAPPKFNILVAAIVSPSDPSRGINPTVARTGFTLQQVVTQNGVGRIGGPIEAPPAPSALDHTAVITVESADFADPTVTPAPPFLVPEEVSLFDRYVVAAENFGVGEGGGAGSVATIADQLAISLNAYPGIKAVSDGVDSVFITSHSLDAFLPVKATGDESVALGGVAPFSISVDGVLLTKDPNYRQTFFVMKTAKTQSPPVSLP